MKEGEWISMSGDSGEILKGKVPNVEPSISGNFNTFIKWVKIIAQKVEVNIVKNIELLCFRILKTFKIFIIEKD